MRPRSIAALAVLCASGLAAEEPVPPRMTLPRITSPITIDGDLSDPGWAEAAVVDTFYEFQPGDGTVPPVKTIARVGRDDKFFYASFWCEEPDVSKIRAPFVDRDGITDQQDYVGVLLDVDNARRAAVDFWISPRGIQTDSILNESPFGEDNAPDYFWKSAGKIGTGSWTAEVAIPLSSLRYPNKDPAGLGADAVPRLAPRVQLPVLQREDAAGLELLSLLVCDGREDRGPAAGDALRRRALCRGLLRPGLPRRRRIRGRRPGDQGQDRHGPQVASRRGHDRGRDDQSGLLAGRGRRRPDRRQRTVRALLPGEAAVLPRRGQPVPDAHPGDLHAHDHQPALGRARDEPPGTELLHGARHRRPRGRDGHHPGARVLRRRAAGHQVVRGHRPRPARSRALLRERPRHGARGRGRFVQLRLRQRLPVARPTTPTS